MGSCPDTDIDPNSFVGNVNTSTTLVNTSTTLVNTSTTLVNTSTTLVTLDFNLVSFKCSQCKFLFQVLSTLLTKA